MEKSNKIAALILGAAAGVALVRFFSMPKEEQEELCAHIKNKTSQLLDNAEDSVEKIEHFMEEFKSKEANDWIDKLYVLKKMLKDFYGAQKHLLL
ncbi:MAG: hypothetical protein ABI208_09005 [Ginsengibacter sp.]|jgi:uncharacterized membrane-anchored protein YhcB (DUF1043 family)